jgi:hypothetical protein
VARPGPTRDAAFPVNFPKNILPEGRESLIPGFKYRLTRPEIDSIIEDLKTVKRPSSRPNHNRTADNPELSSGGEKN